MPYRFLEHTADIRMEIWADSLENLFSDAFYGMMNYLKPSKSNYFGLAKRIINVSSLNPTNLLIDFLNEVLASTYIHKEIYNEVKFINFPQDNSLNFYLEAEIMGVGVDNFKEDIKAITYHNASLSKRSDGLWSIILIFDI